MATLCLHIGMPKTGTTSFQNWLATNSDVFRNSGVFVFSRPLFAHRFAVEAITSTAIRERNDVRQILQCDFNEVRQELANAISQNNFEFLLISSEYFCEADPMYVKSMVPPSHSVKVVAVLRRQDRYIESSYNEEVRAGRTRRLEAPKYWPHFDWWRVLSEWEHSFSLKAVKPLVYEDVIARDAPLGLQILHTFDPKLCEIARTQCNREQRANPSISAQLVEMQRLANFFHLPIVRLVGEAGQEALRGPEFRLDSRVAKQWVEVYRESNRRLAQVFGLSRKELFPEEDLNSGSRGADCTGKLSPRLIAKLLGVFLKRRFKI